MILKSRQVFRGGNTLIFKQKSDDDEYVDTDYWCGYELI
jgi:hypothetical protein